MCGSLNNYIYFIFELQMHEDILNFLDYCENILNRSVNVIEHHKYTLAKWEKFLTKKYWHTPKTKEIWFTDCTEFIEHIKSKVITTWPNKWSLPKHNTIVEYVKSIRAFMGYMGLLNKTSWNINLFPSMKKERGFRDMCQSDEFEILCKWMLEYSNIYTINYRNHLLIDIAYHTGLRRNELLRLKFSDFESPFMQFEIKRKFWYIDPVVFDERLQMKVRIYRLLLDVYLKKRSRTIDNDYLFISLENRNFWKILRPKYLDSAVAKVCDKLIEEWKLKRRIHLHMLRHSFATNCVYAWLSQQAVSTLMGHRSMSTTLRYFNLSNKYIQNEYKKVMRFLSN